MEELLKHPYLQAKGGRARQNSAKTSSSNLLSATTAGDGDEGMAKLLAKLQNAMTPNTRCALLVIVVVDNVGYYFLFSSRQGLSRAMSKLSNSDTNLAALKTLDFA